MFCNTYAKFTAAGLGKPAQLHLLHVICKRKKRVLQVFFFNFVPLKRMKQYIHTENA